MTRDDIIRAAREAGGLDLLCASYGFTDTLERFFQAAYAAGAAAEREACAKVCEAHMEMFPDFEQYCRGGIEGLTTAAAAIRARGETK